MGESEIDLIDARLDISDIMKSKFLQYSRLVSGFLIISNFGVYFLPKYYKALLMSSILITGVIFMVLSLIVLSIKFPNKIYQRYIKPILKIYCNYNCICFSYNKNNNNNSFDQCNIDNEQYVD